MGACVLEAALAKPVITKLADSLLNCIRRANAMHFVLAFTQLVRRREAISDTFLPNA